MAKALTVEKVTLTPTTLLNSKFVIIHVIGTVNSSGWTQPLISPYFYIAPPADGLYDFDLEATPPSGQALTMLTPISLSLVLPNPPKWFKGVRVHASRNNLTAVLEGSFDMRLSDKPHTQFDGDFPWPDVFLKWDGDLPWPDVLRATSGGGTVGNG